MIIAIEAQRIFRKKKHGMDFVALEIIRQLQLLDKLNTYYILVAPGEDSCLTPTPNVHLITLSCPTYILWEQIALPLAVRRLKPDVLHCTSNTAPLYCPVPLVLTLHDIIYLEPRQASKQTLYQQLGWYYRKLVVPRILPHCQKIITVSQFERQRILAALSIDSSKLVAVHNGFSQHFKPIDHPAEVTKKYIDAEKYLFFLGNTDPKKNTARTLKAYSLYVQQTPNPLPLLVVDLPKAYLDQVLESLQMPFLASHIHSTGYVSNADLPAIYSGAVVFLYTSLRESFGIPLLEAMACGTPVITSNTSSMPEIAADAALYVDPLDENDIANQLIRLVNNANLRKEMTEKGFERVKHFSWEQAAKETRRVYASILTA